MRKSPAFTLSCSTSGSVILWFLYFNLPRLVFHPFLVVLSNTGSPVFGVLGVNPHENKIKLRSILRTEPFWAGDQCPSFPSNECLFQSNIAYSGLIAVKWPLQLFVLFFLLAECTQVFFSPPSRWLFPLTYPLQGIISAVPGPSTRSFPTRITKGGRRWDSNRCMVLGPSGF